MVNHNQRSFTVFAIISVMLNLLLSGIIIGYFLKQANIKPIHREHLFINNILHHLPATSIQKIQPILNAHQLKIMAKKYDLYQIRETVFTALAKENFDKNLVAENLQKLRQAILLTQTTMHDVFLNIMQILTQEERIQLLNSVKHDEFNHENFQVDKNFKVQKFHAKDINQDGKLSLLEFKQNRLGNGLQNAKTRFKIIDENNDNFITMEEIVKFKKN
jgi:Spy/CpxP family protein refolding chaperone